MSRFDRFSRQNAALYTNGRFNGLHRSIVK